jgi:hypothetical protein
MESMSRSHREWPQSHLVAVESMVHPPEEVLQNSSQYSTKLGLLKV